MAAVSNKVDISGLDKLQVLKALWMRSVPAAFFKDFPMMIPGFDEKQAKAQLEKPYPYFDYFCGRCIKTSFSTSELDSYLYDRDYGKGAMEKVVADLRQALKA